MNNITEKEMEAVLTIVKSPETMYNANSLAPKLSISAMGALKILKRLEQEGILKAKQIGKSVIYRINVENEYAQRFVTLLLSREALQSSSTIKHWIEEIKKLKHAHLAILFGSVLYKKDPSDVDVLLVTNQRNFNKLQENVKELNKLNARKIHPLYQSHEDIIKNIKKRDKPLLNAIKGIIVFGEDLFLEVYDESRKE